jgi:hypothetical protein
MAHFAEIDAQGTVLRVVVVHNNELMDNGQESEAKGIAFCQSLFGGNWVQTSYNGRIRKNYAGVGFTYDSQLDAFVPPKLFQSWVLNEQLCVWEAPVAMPDDGQRYVWNEATTSWVVMEGV